MRHSFIAYLFLLRWPMYLVSLAALVFAIIRWKRHPKVSLLAILALLLLMGQSLAFNSIFYFLPRLAQQGFSYGAIDRFYIVVEVCRDIVYAVIVGLLVSAAFSQRSATTLSLPPVP
jgi:hypothetical protein